MQQQNKNQNSTSDELDQLLDAALKHYAAVQPREGLEGRILAHLRSQSAERDSHAWWRWLTAVAALAVIITMALRPHAKPQPTVAQHPSVTLPAPKLAASSQPKRAVRRPKRRLHAVAETEVAQALPKLDQFPSPQPLSEQEKRLAAYVGRHYQEAVLMARAREEELEQYHVQDEAEESQVNRPNQNTH